MSFEPLDSLSRELASVPRLHTLVKQAGNRIDELEHELDEAQEKARHLEQQLADTSADLALEELLDTIADFCRGIRGLDEVVEKAREHGLEVVA
jgi:predicted  nucleic acid-binding Zn-ribbon protein